MNPVAGRLRPILMACVMMAVIMQALDTTIANVALPYMQGSLSATQDQITWVLTSYIVAAAIMTPPVGWMAARYGRRAVFLVSVAGFTGASMLCGIAGSLEQIVLYRLLQGVFGAALVPLAQAVMLDLFPREKAGQGMAVFGMGVMLGPILGPTLGGWLTENFDWRWVFFVNLPIGALAFFGLLATLPRGGENPSLRMDWFGFALLSLAIGALQMFLDRGEQLNWFGSTEIIVEALLAGTALYVFVMHTLTANRPFLDRALFADRNLVAGLVVMFAVGIVLLASMALVTPYLQNLMGYPVLLTGLVLGPRGIGTMAAMMIVGRLVGRFDPRLLMLFGLLVIAGSLYHMSGFTPEVSASAIIATGMVQGFGLGFVFVPLQTMAFATLDPRRRTDGASLLSLIRNIGSSVGISVVTIVLTQGTTINHATLTEQVSPFRDAIGRMAGTAWDISTETGLAALDAEVTRQAAVIAYANDYLLMTLVALGAMPLLLLMRRPRRPATGPAAPAHAVME